MNTHIESDHRATEVAARNKFSQFLEIKDKSLLEVLPGHLDRNSLFFSAHLIIYCKKRWKQVLKVLVSLNIDWKKSVLASLAYVRKVQINFVVDF